jgi:hypothetical protein
MPSGVYPRKHAYRQVSDFEIMASRQADHEKRLADIERASLLARVEALEDWKRQANNKLNHLMDRE